jgi:hypothetical protein
MECLVLRLQTLGCSKILWSKLPLLCCLLLLLAIDDHGLDVHLLLLEAPASFLPLGHL